MRSSAAGSMPLRSADHEAMAAALEASGDYRVLRRLKPRQFIAGRSTQMKLGIVLDLETTGMDPAEDEIIEIAMVPFAFTPEGRIVDVREPWRRLRQPSIPISAEITAITGLDAAAVAGHIIDPAEIAAFIGPAVVIIAHHAAFDRPFAERLCGTFAAKAWACSMDEIDWAAEGFDGKKLSYLAAEAGFFYDRHKAAEDCIAVVELLARPLPKSGALALAKLLEAARRPTSRIWATYAPFEVKDTLKARGYRWNDGADGRPKAWFIDVQEPAAADEIAWLHREVYRSTSNLRVDRMTAFTRFRA